MDTIWFVLVLIVEWTQTSTSPPHDDPVFFGVKTRAESGILGSSLYGFPKAFRQVPPGS
jgi:hypothetical protein